MSIQITATPRLDDEWLLTDGYGGYAMGTARGSNSRRYHGLLVHAQSPPVDRLVILHSVADELVLASGQTIPLWSQQFGVDAAIGPTGAVEPTVVRLDSFERVIWRWQTHGRIVTRTLSLPERGVAMIAYDVQGAEHGDHLVVRPLMPLRSFHGIGREAEVAPPRCEPIEEGFDVRRGRIGAVVDASRVLEVDPTPQWWHDFAYVEDRSRGQEWLEDVFSPGRLLVPTNAVVRATTSVPESDLDLDADSLIGAGSAARQFLARRRGTDDRWGWSMLAGFPWFADWGRDTMIALPGLLLACGELEVARSILSMFARHLRDGLIPNRFDDYNGPAEYNTVDASLWFIDAVGRYSGAAGHCDDELIAACASIIDAYREGTRFGIRMDVDGLITAGDETTQLTWMDAKRGGTVFTPRHGKAVEINALWHRALHVGSELLPRREAEWVGLAARVRERFTAAYWWQERGCLHDVLLPGHGGDVPDGRMRPNQIFAVSLRSGLLAAEQERAIVEAVQTTLLTPYGLRTLDPGDASYRGRYEGDLFSRDAAYHNGTVWPWLMAPFCTAYRHVHGDGPAVQQTLREMTATLRAEREHGCLGQIAEVYDGDHPHRASGCPAQAWSTAALLECDAWLAHENAAVARGVE